MGRFLLFKFKAMIRYYFLSLISLIALNLSAQITTTPQLPVAGSNVTITFNSSEESRLGYFTGDLYAHTGVTLENSGQWQNVIGDWKNNDNQPQLTNLGNGIYELQITPDINTYYSVASGDQVTELCFVFRSADGTQQTNDLFVEVYEDGLVVNITAPEENTIVENADTILISAESSAAATLKLFANDSLLSETTGETISSEYIVAESEDFWIIAEATADSTVRDSLLVAVRPGVIEATKPAAYKKGINYTSETSAALVLWAPLKEFVYVIGDFNNWEVSPDYLMKQDGNYFWLDIDDLEPGEEYAFQYYIDGQIKVADPYTEKILDPWNDSYISETTYPNLKAYPDGKTENSVSILQTNQEEYAWEVSDFEMPEKDEMVIYEMLIRDFTEEHTYASVIEKLDYLEDLRINVLELMPVNEFEGNSSWGYNPAFYFAPDKYYGPKNDLKKLIDECHKRGIAVVIDMVLNHSYGQSPFVQMYMDNWVVTDENPWYNVSSPNTSYSWGYDFNHEAEATQELVDSINAFWMSEYKVDGFRFDFTKGFTNTTGDGWTYDQSRIDILQRMADEIWKRNDDALVILEHLTDNSEEKVLANYGMMLWGNLNYNYAETAMGYNENLSWGIYSNRGWDEPNLVSYMESHDEERVAYKCLTYGASSGDYSTQNLATALDRIELNALFFLPLPGPKMIWQFGELGYDYSINTCEDETTIDDGCRTSPKPIVWDYSEDSDRSDLFETMAQLNGLKQSCDEFSSGTLDYSLANTLKWYSFTRGDSCIFALGNFDVEATEAEISFPKTGKWYEYFSGDSINIAATTQTLSLEPGEYRLYSTRKLAIQNVVTAVETIREAASELTVYPNPATDLVTLEAEKEIRQIQLYNIQGKQMMWQTDINEKKTEINVDHCPPGIYLVRVVFDDTIQHQKISVK